MPQILLVTSGKGGTGKSTVSALLGLALAQRKKSVLIVELDSGLRGLDLMLGVSDQVVYDLSDVLTGGCRPSMAVTACPLVRQGKLDLIAAPVDRYFVPDEAHLAALLSGLGSVYDFVLLDTAAGLGEIFDVAHRVCTLGILVCTCHPVSVRDAAAASEILADRKTRLLINQFSRRQLGGELPHLDAIIDRVRSQLLGVVPEDPIMAKAFAVGCSPAGSPAVAEADDIAGRLLGERIPLQTNRYL